MSEIHTFRAACDVHVAASKDDVLAEALSVIDPHHPIEEARADERKSTPTRLVWVTVVFVAANTAESIRTARLTAEALSHKWPTDSVSIDGRPMSKFHNHSQEG